MGRQPVHLGVLVVALVVGACGASPATLAPASAVPSASESSAPGASESSLAPEASGDVAAPLPTDLSASIPPIEDAVASFALPMDAFDYAAAQVPSLEASRKDVVASGVGLLARVEALVARQVPTPSASPAAAASVVDGALTSVRSGPAVGAAAPAADNPGTNYTTLGAVTVLLGQTFNRLADGAVEAPTVSGTGKMTEGTATTGMGMKVKLADKTGNSEFDLSADTVVVKDVNGTATTYQQGIGFGFKGRVCPDASGMAEFDAKMRFTGDAASGPGSSRELAATIRITVNDNGDVAASDISIRQTAIEHPANGPRLTLETTMPVSFAYGSDGSTTVTRNAAGWANIDQRSNVSQADLMRLLRSANDDGIRFAVGAIRGAEVYFQGGGCIRIDATAPGTVQPGATTQIPVSVTHKLDGSAIAAKVTVALKGTRSVSPDVIAKAPGTVTHIAGDKATKGTITLTASSKRGRATLDLTINADGGYTAVGGGPGISVSGSIPDLTAPFTLEGAGEGFTITFSYTPAADGRSGAVTYEGGGSGFEMSGSGTYTVTGKEGGPLKLVQTTDGCVKGYGCKTTTETMTLTPVVAP